MENGIWHKNMICWKILVVQQKPKMSTLFTNQNEASMQQGKRYSNGLIALMETDLGTDSDSDSKPDGYIILYRDCSNCMDSDPYSLFLYRTGILVRLRTPVRLRQCKWAITS